MWLRQFANLRHSICCSICLLVISPTLLCSAEQSAEKQSNATAQSPSFTGAQIEFFEKKIRPILIANCYDCHGPDASEANLRVDARHFLLKGGDTGPSLIPGKPDESEFISAIQYSADSYQMPPDGKLSAENIDLLIQWVKMGAPWPEEEVSGSGAEEHEFNIKERSQHWSFQPVKNVSLPNVNQTNWPREPLDYFILRRLEQAELKPAATVSKRVWLRRVTFDLIGLPPTLEEFEAFEKDESEEAYEKVVERLLASEQYGVRWARHWLDLVRFSETMGHEFDYNIPYAWKYRDYVVRAFNEDVPYNKFVQEHIAGDLFENPRRTAIGNNESILGTSFYWLGQGKHSPVDIRAEECDIVDNQIDVLSKTFLGLTVSCARCHDHKFDPISTKDYYALAGYLQSSRMDWANINDTPQTKAILKQLRALSQQQHKSLTRTMLSELSNQFKTASSKKEFQKQLQQKLFSSPAIENSSHPLYLWKQLSATSEIKTRTEKLKAAQQQSTQHATAIGSATQFTSFQPEESDNWFHSGWGATEQFANGGELVLGGLQNNRWELTNGRSLNTTQLGNKLQSTVRSQTFEIKHNYLYYKAHQQEGGKKPNRQYKTGEINLIVDGFQIIKPPLHGHLSLSVPANGKTVWLKQNVTKLVGHRAYIEIADEDASGLVVEDILFSDTELPNLSVNSNLAATALSTNDIESKSQLDAFFLRLIEKTIAKAVLTFNGTDLENKLTPDEYALLNSVLAVSNSFFSSKTQSAIKDFKAETTKLLSALPEPELAVAMTSGTPENEYVLIRGNHRKLGDEVPQRFLEVFSSLENGVPQTDRLDLAKKIASGNNSLTSRVIVNRLWNYHFGRGIVPSTDNFGLLGKLPTHPELLDYLATELIRENWSLKAMHRKMVLSSTYRMSSEIGDEAATEIDPANELWHRMSVRRLEGEAIRDSILAVSGQLDGKLFGPSVPVHLTPFMEGRGRPKRSGPLDGERRRSLFLNVRRNFLNPMFLAFDYPTPNTTTGHRSVSNVPAQALTMMNNPFVAQQAKHWAKSVLENQSAESDNETSRIKLMYQTAFGRNPLPKELAFGQQFLQQQREEYTGDSDQNLKTWSDYAHVLFNVKDFIYIK